MSTIKSAQLAAQVRISQPFLVVRFLFGTSGLLLVSKLTVSIRMCISIFLLRPHVLTAGWDLRAKLACKTSAA
jgi:hypothetical protein